MALATSDGQILEEFDHEFIRQGHSAKMDSKEIARSKRAVPYIALAPKATPESLAIDVFNAFGQPASRPGSRHGSDCDAGATQTTGVLPGWLGAEGR